MQGYQWYIWSHENIQIHRLMDWKYMSKVQICLKMVSYFSPSVHVDGFIMFVRFAALSPQQPYYWHRPIKMVIIKISKD